MELPRRTTYIQILVVSIIVLIVVILAFMFIPRTIPPDQHRVTLRVESSSGSATIQYSAGDHVQRDSEKTFNTPWEMTWVLKSGTQVILTAGNHQQTGSISCSLLLDGAKWKYNSVKMPEDKVACGGIVR